jgi:Protein of unknwon function (DUF3310)
MRGRGTMQSINFENPPTKFMFTNPSGNEYVAEYSDGFYNVYQEKSPNQVGVWDAEDLEKSIRSGSFKLVCESNPIKPDHYHQNGIDVIQFSKMQFSKEEVRGFMRINILKYATRYHRKNGVEDLKKMIEYAEQLIELEESK